MNILALDLGTRTGWCYNRGIEIQQGTWTLAKPKEITQWGKERLDRRCDPRPTRLNELLIPYSYELDVVIFEDVFFTSYTKQVQLWSSLRTAVWMVFSHIKLECISPTTLKKFAGHGAMTKQGMSRALKKQHPSLWAPHLDDSQASPAVSTIQGTPKRSLQVPTA